MRSAATAARATSRRRQTGCSHSRSRPSSHEKSVRKAPGARCSTANADKAFNAWYTARYIDEIAAAGQAELRSADVRQRGRQRSVRREGGRRVASGGADWPVLDVWKVAAPHIAICRARPLRSRLQGLQWQARPDGAARQCPVRARDRQRPRVRPLLLAGARQGRDRLGRRSGWTRPMSIIPLGAKDLGPEKLDAFAVQIRADGADRARLGAARLRTSDGRLRQGRGRVRPVGNPRPLEDHGAIWAVGVRRARPGRG